MFATTCVKHENSLKNYNLNKNPISKIIYDDEIHTSSSSIAKTFNEYFCSIAQNLDESLPSSQSSPYINVTKNCLGSLNLYRVSKTECITIINNLKNTHQDLNSIPIHLFKKLSKYYVNIICDLINTSFLQGKFPDFLKISTVIPILKKGEPTLVSNYRPISLLHFLSKLFERCIGIY